MKTLNIPLENKDYRIIKKAKNLNHCKTWKDYLMVLTEKKEE